MGGKSSTGRKKDKSPAAPRKQRVTLLRLGVGKVEYELPEGSTLADLLRQAGEVPERQDILVDGRPITERVVLESGTIVSFGPKSNGALMSAPWLETIGTFRDDPTFDEMMRDVEANRNPEREEG